MPTHRVAGALLALLLSSLANLSHADAARPSPWSPAALENARTLRERALTDDTAWDLLASLTTEVGPRFAGSEGDARAVAWAVQRLRSLGFRNVRAESVTVPRWVRGEARAEITAPWPHRMVAVALGGSPPTPDGGIEAEVVPVTSIDELKRLPSGRVRDRIVFFTRRMERTRDASGYGPAVAARSRGADEASLRGALGIVIRSVGTSSDRLAHTGGQRHADSVRAIPALALSAPDADLLERQLASGRTVRVRLFTSSRYEGQAKSANVVGEVPGRSREVVLLGAHLDSWDLGTGAHDDAAGVATVTAAARLIAGLRSPPRRTLRVVLFANEEFGLSGAEAYARAHPDSLEPHAIGMESDLGAFAPYGLASRVPHDRVALVQAMASLAAPLGIVFGGNDAGGGADLGPLRERGMPVLEVETDASRYFDLHHTANDTLDKVDPALLRRNVAVYAMLAYLAAEAEGGFGRLPR